MMSEQADKSWIIPGSKTIWTLVTGICIVLSVFLYQSGVFSSSPDNATGSVKDSTPINMVKTTQNPVSNNMNRVACDVHSQAKNSAANKVSEAQTGQ